MRAVQAMRSRWVRLIVIFSVLYANVRATTRFVNVDGVVEAAGDAARLATLVNGNNKYLNSDYQWKNNEAQGFESTRSKRPQRSHSGELIGIEPDLDAVVDYGFLDMYLHKSLHEKRSSGDLGLHQSNRATVHGGSRGGDQRRRHHQQKGQEEQRKSGSTLTVAQQAYLYDDIFLQDGKVLTEAHLPEANLHRSRAGWDDPNWRSLRTRWDQLPGIRKRTGLVFGVAESEADLRFLNNANTNPQTLRVSLEQKILDQGRGNPLLFESWSQLGNTLRALGETHASIQCFRRALSLNPDDAGILTNLALVLRFAGYSADAAKIMRYIISLGVGSALHYFVLGSLQLDTGELDHAIANFQITLKKRPDFMPALHKLRELRAPLQGSDSTSVTMEATNSGSMGSINSVGSNIGREAGPDMTLGQSIEDVLITLIGCTVIGLLVLYARGTWKRPKRRSK